MERSQAAGTTGPLCHGLLCVQGRDGIEAVRLQGPGQGGDKLWPLVFGDARSGVPSVLVWWLPFVLGLDVLRAFFVSFW